MVSDEQRRHRRHRLLRTTRRPAPAGLPPFPAPNPAPARRPHRDSLGSPAEPSMHTRRAARLERRSNAAVENSGESEPASSTRNSGSARRYLARTRGPSPSNTLARDPLIASTPARVTFPNSMRRHSWAPHRERAEVHRGDQSQPRISARSPDLRIVKRSDRQLTRSHALSLRLLRTDPQ